MRRAYRVLIAGVLAIMLLLTAGCGYRPVSEAQTASPAAIKESILIVQNAVDEFHKQTGVLPIKNSTESTPIYEKYPVDMKKLQDRRMFSQIPSNAFEKGGSYEYVIVHAETKHEVKMLDLAAYQQTGNVQKWVNDYAGANGGKLPLGAEIAPGIHGVDFQALNKKTEQVKSPYSRQFLPFIMDDKGTVYIDYSIDLAALLAKKGTQAAGQTSDLRELLVAEYPVVPVKSLPYELQGDAPIPIPKS